MGEASFDDVAKTLDCIESLSPLRVIPGHGPIFNDVTGSLTTARRRLDALQKSPAKHAKHAVKVLIKFKLLEWQRVTRDDWCTWRDSTPYLHAIRERFFVDLTVVELCDQLLSELVASRAASVEREIIWNL